MPTNLSHVSDGDLILQVRDQCTVVSGLAKDIGFIYGQKIGIVEDVPREVQEAWFESTVNLMNTLGDILNAMDAVDGGRCQYQSSVMDQSRAIIAASKQE